MLERPLAVSKSVNFLTGGQRVLSYGGQRVRILSLRRPVYPTTEFPGRFKVGAVPHLLALPARCRSGRHACHQRRDAVALAIRLCKPQLLQAVSGASAISEWLQAQCLVA